MNTSKANNVPDFAHSVGVVVGILKDLRDKGHNQAALLAAFNTNLHNADLFAKAQRSSAVKAINKQMGTSFTMSQIRKAAPMQPIPTDELVGEVELKNGEQPQDNEVVQLVNQTLDNLLALTSPEVFADRQKLYESFLAEHDLEMVWDNSEVTTSRGLVSGMDVAIAQNLELDEGLKASFNEYAQAYQAKLTAQAQPEPEKGVHVKVIADDALPPTDTGVEAEVIILGHNSGVERVSAEAQQPTETNTTLEQDTMATTAQAAVAQEEQVKPVEPMLTLPYVLKHGRDSKPVLDRLAACDAQAQVELVKSDILNSIEKHFKTDGELQTFLDELFVAHPKFARPFTGMKALIGETSLADHVEKFLLANDEAKVAFDMQLAAKFPAAATEPAQERSFIQRSIRGDRETGFSSGAVAVAAAIVGGGAEMAFRGGVSIGSAVGTVLGAAGAYFAAEASEKAMDSETGRYILGGSIGFVAGGLGASVGRMVQGSLNTTEFDEAIVSAVPELAPAAPAPAIGNDGFGSMFGF